MRNRVSGLRADLCFWFVVVAIEAMVLGVAVRSPTLGSVLAGAVGVLVLLGTAIGTRYGTLLLASVMLLVVMALPYDMALRYRIPLGGGGIYIQDVLLALVLVSTAVLYILDGRQALAVRTPVRLPMLLLLLWTAGAAVIGVMSGNEIKLVLQDARVLVYYSLFLFASAFVAERRDMLALLRVMAVGMTLAFSTGVFYALKGEGTTLDFVEAGVTRFPASNDLFLMGSVLATAFVVVWPADRRRPFWLWGVLMMAVVGLVLSFVRGFWLAFVVGTAYLLLMLRVHERMRLIAGVVVLGVVLTVGVALVRPTFFESILSRAMAVTEVSDRNVQWRLIENQTVGRQIAEKPLLGNGLGKDYLFDWSRYGVTPYRKSYIHNSYLWYVQRMGVVGLSLFVWVMAAYLFPWMRYRNTLPRDDPWLTGIVYGGRATTIALLAASVTSPLVNSMTSVATLALVMGMSEVGLALLLQRTDQEDATIHAPLVDGAGVLGNPDVRA